MLWENGKNERNSATLLANMVEAEAEVKNPDKVTPTWIVARKLLEFFVVLRIFSAPLWPFLAIFLILFSFSVMMAISDIAKKALIKIKINNKSIWKISFIFSPSVSIFIFLCKSYLLNRLYILH